jgi:hypothetical protein
MVKSKVEKENFPHVGFPWKLIHKDLKENKTCYFQCEEHMLKYIERYKIKKKDCKIFTINGEDIQEIKDFDNLKKTKTNRRTKTK